MMKKRKFYLIFMLLILLLLVGCGGGYSISEDIPAKYVEFSTELMERVMKEDKRLITSLSGYNHVFFREDGEDYMGLHLDSGLSFNRDKRTLNYIQDKILEDIDKVLSIMGVLVRDPDIKSPDNFYMMIDFKTYIKEYVSEEVWSYRQDDWIVKDVEKRVKKRDHTMHARFSKEELRDEETIPFDIIQVDR